MAHQEYNYNGANYSVIFTTIQGTDGSAEQWNSNFDIGLDDESYYSKMGQNENWINKKNHRGFDIGANLVNKDLTEYLKKIFRIEDSKKNLAFTGHSRGTAIANILGAVYESKNSFKTFTYTYATPGVTQDKENAVKIKTVFNILNADDVVPVMPMEKWGFTRNGLNKSVSINESYAADWVSLTKKSEYVSADAQTACSDEGYLLKLC